MHAPHPQGQPRPLVNSGTNPTQPPNPNRRPATDNTTYPLQPGPAPSAAQVAYEAQHHALAHWLIEIHRPGPNSRIQLWQLMTSSRFADLWYGSRASGEILRRETLRWLSLHQPRPGGTNPDPRIPADQAPFSARAVVTVAASQILGVTTWPIPEPDAATEADALSLSCDRPRPLCWIVSNPHGRPPAIAIRHSTDQQAKLMFDVAQLLGYINKERQRLADPDAPGGIILLPTDTAIETVLHQFAIALLGLPPDCPAEWPCVCNALRARYNAAPPSHEQASEALSLDELRATRTRWPAPVTRPLDPPDSAAPGR